jgi:energy-coupling factor transport system permease protein
VTIRAVLFDIDDRVKVWMAMTGGAGAIYCVDWRIQVAILAVSLVLCGLCGAWRFVVGFNLVLLVLALVSLGITRLSPDESKIWGRGLLFILLKFGPLFTMMVFVQTCLNTSRFLRSLEKLHVPRQWVIPLGVCLRFMPSVVAECRQIRFAMRIRGIALTPGRLIKRPLETVGYLMVPLLVRSLYIGDELARAAVARGIESPVAKTCLYDLRFRPSDGIAMTLWTLGLAALMAWDQFLYAWLAGGTP